MIPYLQFHPDAPIGGYEVSPIRKTGSRIIEKKAYETPKIRFFSPGEDNHKRWSKERKERHSSSSYIPPDYSVLLDGNNSRSQSSKADGTQYCCTLGHNEMAAPSSPSSCPAECLAKTTPSTTREARESCHAPECVAKPSPNTMPSGAPPSQIEKWISEMEYRNYMATRIPSIDGANTPPEPLTSISNPPLTFIHHSQSIPTAPLPIPIENPNPTDTTSKLKDSLRNKRGKKGRQGLRKFRKIIFRKEILKVVLGRQLAQPTADLLDMMAKGIEFEAPDMKALAKPPVPTGPVPL